MPPCPFAGRHLQNAAQSPMPASSVRSPPRCYLVPPVCFSLPRASVPGWWIWAYYLSPLSWSLQAVVINEMTQDRWRGALAGSEYTMGAPLHPFGEFCNSAAKQCDRRVRVHLESVTCSCAACICELVRQLRHTLRAERKCLEAQVPSTREAQRRTHAQPAARCGCSVQH
jgi:hypothetical protein